MLAKTFDEAANVLGEAVELAWVLNYFKNPEIIWLSTDFFGAFAHQSFLPHYNYGKALVEVSNILIGMNINEEKIFIGLISEKILNNFRKFQIVLF